MNVPLMRLPPQIDAPAVERRREHRHNAATGATLQFASGSRIAVELADVSLHGCCVRGGEGRLQQGRILSVGLGDHPMLDGIVRWVRQDTAGMEFLRPIPVERFEWHELMETGFGS